MTTIAVAETPLVLSLLRLADTALVHSHRLSEWCGHAPMIEEDLALANFALDLLGQARALYAYAAEVEGAGRTEDDLAYLRDAPQYRNVLMAELPRGDFAFTILRGLFLSAWAHPFWQAATGSTDTQIAAIAAKAEKEAAYHVRHTGEWTIRLGDGTDESRRRMLAALEALWPYTGELFEADAADRAMIAAGVLPDPARIRPAWEATIARVFDEALLPRPADGWMQTGGRSGRHTEHLGHMLAVMQHLQRAYPGCSW